jgi:hypothetical protein
MCNLGGMTKPTDSKVPAAFQAMLAFLRYLLTGQTIWQNEREALGVLAAIAASSDSKRAATDSDVLALRDLVQAAAAEHAGSAVTAAPSAAGNPFVAIKERSKTDGTYFLPPTSGEHETVIRDRAWLIGEVERLRAIEAVRVADVDRVLTAFKASVGAVGPMPARTGDETGRRVGACPSCYEPGPTEREWANADFPGRHPACGCFYVTPEGEERHCRIADEPEPEPAWTVPQPSASLHVGVDPTTPGSDRTVTQVREPAFDRLRAAVDDVAFEPLTTRGQRLREAFDAFTAEHGAERPVLTEEAAQKWARSIVFDTEGASVVFEGTIADALLAASRGECPTT